MKRLIVLLALLTLVLPPSAWAQANGVFVDGFESGNLDAWTKAATKDGHLYVSPLAKFTGDYGALFDVEGLPEDSKPKLWLKDTSPEADARYDAAWAFNLHDLVPPADPRVVRIVTGRMKENPDRRPFEVRLLYSGGAWT
ncbi:MAG: hypothetical protein ACKOCT_00495, partial [Alphaproteobacteria bacterium]